MKAELIVDASATLGEGPWWDEREGVLYWVDIIGETLFRYHPASGENETISVGEMVGTVVLGDSGAIYLAVKEGFARFNADMGTLHYLARPSDHPPENRFNEGKCSPEGRFWAGTMGLKASPNAGALYRLDADLSCHRILTDITISNGIVWTADQRTMYYIDTAAFNVVAFDYDIDSGKLSHRREVIAFPRDGGGPDGMAIDINGNLWVAHFGGWAVRCWDPRTGAQLAQIDVPVKNVTACAFGGPDLRSLYITTHGGDKPDKESEPHAGGLFVAEPGVTGQLNHRFADN